MWYYCSVVWLYSIPDIKMLVLGRSDCSQLTNIILKSGKLTSHMVISNKSSEVVLSQNVLKLSHFQFQCTL
jgi:hypothetical protein